MAKPFVNLTANTLSESLVAKPVPSVTSSRSRQSPMVVFVQRRAHQLYLPSHTQIGTQRSDKMFGLRENSWSEARCRPIRIASRTRALSTEPPDDAQSIHNRPIPRNETRRRCILLTRPPATSEVWTFHVLSRQHARCPECDGVLLSQTCDPRTDRDVSVTPFVASQESEGESP